MESRITFYLIDDNYFYKNILFKYSILSVHNNLYIYNTIFGFMYKRNDICLAKIKVLVFNEICY